MFLALIKDENQDEIKLVSKEEEHNHKLNKKKYKKEENDDTEVESSNNLAKIFDMKYNNNSKSIDILSILREYVLLAISTSNNFNNTKYNTLYILKTHKHHLKLFQSIQVSKDYTNLW